ncbi:MAG: DNA mismatch repair endonuclease MutL [Chlamydiota bacterium]
MKIERLPELLINQIAAGEVIENPSSVVKELVENAIDAKSQRIVVEIQGGGLQLIRVQDDGTGMTLTDLEMSIERHATSKLRKFEDFLSLQTMGFRGEALASIASIAKLHIESAEEEKTASFIDVEEGKICKKGSCARTRGTSIDIKSLFYNVPVRKKFQKSLSACSAEIHRVVNRFALAYPNVGFTFISQDKKILHLLPNQKPFLVALKERIEESIDPSFLEGCYQISFQEGPLVIRGFLGSPSQTKMHRGGQYLFINQRSVSSYLVSSAVKEAFATRINERDFPTFVLHIDMPGDFVDVNVHPQKKEVRFKEEIFLKQSIRQAIEKAFQKEETLCSPKIRSDFVFSKIESVQPISIKAWEGKNEELFLLPPDENKRFSYRECHVIGPFFVVQDLKKEELVVIDLSGAFARCLFSSYQKKVEKEKISQALLIPVVLTFSKEEIMYLENVFGSAFAGFEVRLVGEKNLSIDAIPSFMKIEEVEPFFKNLIRGFSEKEFALEKSRKLAQNLCAYARGRKKRFSVEEAKHLVDKLFLCEDPFQDPLGRPIFFPLKEEDLARFF